MRISILCGGSHVFGLEKMAITTALGLRERGHQISFIVSGWSDGKFIPIIASAGFQHELVYLGKLSMSLKLRSLYHTAGALFTLPRARAKCDSHFARFNPDAVISYHRDWTLMIRSILRKQRTVFHAQELGDGTGWGRWAYSRLDGAVAAYVAVSEHIGVRLQAMGLSPSKIHVVHNGIPATPESIPKLRNVVPTIGIIGQVGTWKGHDDLLKALGVLRSQNQSFHCMVFGQGDSEYVEKLKTEAAALGIADRLSWPGYVSNTDDIYSGIDICVVPSRFEDPCPVTAIEASMRGLPVVATKRGGLPEIVADNETGFLVEAESPNELADRVGVLLKDGSLRHRFGQAGRRRALAKFTAEAMVDGVEKTLERVVRER
jgi:glycosyltransferase involved in cell wall biosynthesis